MLHLSDFDHQRESDFSFEVTQLDISNKFEALMMPASLWQTRAAVCLQDDKRMSCAEVSKSHLNLISPLDHISKLIGLLAVQVIIASIVEDKMERSIYLTPFSSRALEDIVGKYDSL